MTRNPAPDNDPIDPEPEDVPVNKGPSRVIVFGGTGRSGRLIVNEAVRDGHHVTAAARRPEQLAASGGTFPAAVKVIRADVQDPASVSRALNGQDALILAVSSSARRPGTLYSDAARNITTAASSTGLSRAIIISSGGVYHDDPALPFWFRRLLIPLFMKDLYDDMRVMETIIQHSTLDWTLVRASYLQDRPATGNYRISAGSTPTRGWKLSRADLARFTADQLVSDQWLRKIPTLG